MSERILDQAADDAELAGLLQDLQVARSKPERAVNQRTHFLNDTRSHLTKGLLSMASVLHDPRNQRVYARAFIDVDYIQARPDLWKKWLDDETAWARANNQTRRIATLVMLAEVWEEIQPANKSAGKK